MSSSASPSAAAAAPQMLEPRIYRHATDDAVVMDPPAGAHTAVLVGPIHGLGDSARGWLHGALMLWRQVPHCRFILPDAPVSPVTLNGGFRMPSWYDIVGGGGDRFAEPCEGLDASHARITGLIETEIAAGTPPSRIAVAGFSQGGAMTLVCGLQFRTALAGCLVMSGYLAGANRFSLSAAAKATPVLHLHGKDDAMVRIEWARETRRRVVEDGGHPDYVLMEYPGLGHTVSIQEFSDAGQFLSRVLPPADAAAPFVPADMGQQTLATGSGTADTESAAAAAPATTPTTDSSGADGGGDNGRTQRRKPEAGGGRAVPAGPAEAGGGARLPARGVAATAGAGAGVGAAPTL